MTPAVDIRALRINRGLSVARAAEQIGVPRNTLFRAESGQVRPQPATAFKIATFYGLKPTDVWPLDEPVEAA